MLPLNNPAGAGNLKFKFGMIDAGNDWWWAVDNIALGVPPFAGSVTANGVSFTVNLIEALGKTVNRNTVTVELDGTPVAPVTVTGFHIRIRSAGLRGLDRLVRSVCSSVLARLRAGLLSAKARRAGLAVAQAHLPYTPSPSGAASSPMFGRRCVVPDAAPLGLLG